MEGGTREKRAWYKLKKLVFLLKFCVFYLGLEKVYQIEGFQGIFKNNKVGFFLFLLGNMLGFYGYFYSI